jgi:hypothetical protein
MELHVNLLAVLVAVLANFFFATIWYMPLFGKLWGKEMGFDMSAKPDKTVMIKGMLFMVFGNFLFAWVFAHNIAAWQYVPGINDLGPLVNAITAAFLTWLGFFFPGYLTATVWEKKSWTLFAIDASYQLIALLMTAFILSYWT